MFRVTKMPLISMAQAAIRASGSAIRWLCRIRVRREQWLTHTRQFREALHTQGESLSATIIRARQEEQD